MYADSQKEIWTSDTRIRAVYGRANVSKFRKFQDTNLKVSYMTAIFCHIKVSYLILVTSSVAGTPQKVQFVFRNASIQ
jgi:hypothetical protein